MSRDITQYHYTMWPDHGTPEPLSLAIFHSQMFRTNSDENRPPIVVHCRYKHRLLTKYNQFLMYNDDNRYERYERNNCKQIALFENVWCMFFLFLFKYLNSNGKYFIYSFQCT